VSDESQPGVLRVLTSKAQTRAFYDKISRVYDLLAEHSEAPVRRIGLTILDVGKGERILEIGSGTGRCLAALTAAVGPGGAVHGIDLSEGMLRKARERLRREPPPGVLELACGDAAHLPYASDTFDAIFTSFTLELFDTPEIPRVLSECRRVLRPDGRIVVVGMSKEGPRSAMVHAFEWTHRHFPAFLDCRPIFVRQALEDAGLTIGETRLVEMWVPVEIVLARKRSGP
jgi:demethylmenaquinone methyltransferase/2-methoxy-6-polyprenyl-1,4-benzoquinol methylase